jgi:hypothetical protein
VKRAASPALYLTLVTFIFWLNATGYGALASPAVLGAELHAPAEAPASWPLGDEAPYCYRWLFRAGVVAVAKVVPAARSREGFYFLFIIASALSLLAAALLVDRLLRDLGHSAARARLGTTLFLLGFPVLFAYDFPIHTREDLLAYACVALELVLCGRDRPVLLALAGVLGANVRETATLGLLPYLLDRRRPLATRALAVAPAFVAVALIHVVRAPAVAAHGYLLDGLRVNVAEPGEALLYLFASHGALWVLAPLGLAVRRRDDVCAPGVALAAVGLAVAANALLGMLRECRIVYVAAPWLVGLSLDYVTSARFREVARARAAWLALALVLLAGLVFQLRVATDDGLVDRLRPAIGASFQPGWAPARPLLDERGAPVLDAEGRTVEVIPYLASPWGGTFVTLHLAAIAFVVAGELARRKSAPG